MLGHIDPKIRKKFLKNSYISYFSEIFGLKELMSTEAAVYIKVGFANELCAPATQIDITEKWYLLYNSFGI